MGEILALRFQAERYAERLSINTEDMLSLFEETIAMYDGDETAFLNDLQEGFVITQDGKASSFAYFDSMAQFA